MRVGAGGVVGQPRTLRGAAEREDCALSIVWHVLRINLHSFENDTISAPSPLVRRSAEEIDRVVTLTEVTPFSFVAKRTVRPPLDAVVTFVGV